CSHSHTFSTDADETFFRFTIHGGYMNKSNKGFSLLELLIVVAIILIIATIAIPSLLRSRQAAHEAAAVATLRTINTAEVTYLSTAQGKFGGLSDLTGAGLLPSNFTAGGTVSGYHFAILTATPYTDFTIWANPASANEGRYSYYLVPDGTIRYSTATAEAPAGTKGQTVSQ